MKYIWQPKVKRLPGKVVVLGENAHTSQAAALHYVSSEVPCYCNLVCIFPLSVSFTFPVAVVPEGCLLQYAV